jgi:hypothetical protein
MRLTRNLWISASTSEKESTNSLSSGSTFGPSPTLDRNCSRDGTNLKASCAQKMTTKTPGSALSFSTGSGLGFFDLKRSYCVLTAGLFCRLDTPGIYCASTRRNIAGFGPNPQPTLPRPHAWRVRARPIGDSVRPCPALCIASPIAERKKRSSNPRGRFMPLRSSVLAVFDKSPGLSRPSRSSCPSSIQHFPVFRVALPLPLALCLHGLCNVLGRPPPTRLWTPILPVYLTPHSLCVYL